MEQFNSASYWEKRYASGGNSGAGSHNAFAEFKSSVIQGKSVSAHILFAPK